MARSSTQSAHTGWDSDSRHCISHTNMTVHTFTSVCACLLFLREFLCPDGAVVKMNVDAAMW